MGTFFNASNPLIFLILLTAFVVFALYVTGIKIFIPIKQLHEKEKLLLELKNEKLLSLFASVNPNPLFRFDETGEILISNPSAGELLKLTTPNENNIKNIIDELMCENLTDIIRNSRTETFTSVIGNRTFTVIVIGLGELKFAHAYLSDISERIAYEEKITFSESKLREYAQRLQELSEDLKNKIAMDIHDGVCQTLASIKQRTGKLEGYLQDNITAATLHSEIMQSTDGVLNELRSLSYMLTPKLLYEFGLIASIQMLISQIEGANNLSGSLQIIGEEKRLNPKLEINLYRIVQELLSNIVRHANASFYTMQIIFDEEKITLILGNNGTGFNINQKLKKGSLGLLDIRERVSAFNGTLTITSSPGTGTETIIEMPIV